MGDTDLESTSDDTFVKVIPISKKQITLHPSYQKPAAYFDVAVIYLEDPLAFNQAVRPICLPQVPSENQNGYSGHLVRLIGKEAIEFKFKGISALTFHRLGN